MTKLSQGFAQMKILFCAMRYDYGDPKRGLSYEYYNYIPAFQKLGCQVIPFDYLDLYKKLGRDKMNDLLIKTVKDLKPHLLFCSLFEEQLKKEVIAEISNTKTTTLTWFYDDTWRFDNFCRLWSRVFNWTATTEEFMVEKYSKIGSNAIYLPFAINPKVYKPYKVAKSYDVTFVGGPHGFRNQYYEKLKSENIKTTFFGESWAGRLSTKNMVKLFSQSKINLNFAETSYQGNLPLWYLRRFNLIPRIHQRKARIFEIPGSGGFELSGWSKGIEKLYEPGKEIEIFKSTGELIEKCRYYLKNSKKREKIAQAGYKRTLKDHTYEKRFSSLFKKIGLRKNK